ncbi:hypothetical protein HELRODRAFT_166777 [Helobdella robusta]|uniref:PiggyBac transposable element-derived protein domain-containing protein n=1 Tax=Helobdella robusta TaxID=6412 RepID=T1EYI4_HELRO|nr:hypothetical protein HELRODRAFT_166777 [Helobdella robusta]ESO11749.1 hypothetical protein HELRODRAFT_166777 [Helobdella robusta]
MRRKNFLNLEEAIEYAFSKEIEADILALPPEVDELTDKETINDEELGTPIVADIAGTMELDVPSDEEDTVSLAKQSSTSGHDIPPSKRICAETLKWQKKETMRYATNDKNNPNFIVTGEDIKVFLGFLIFTGYHALENQKHSVKSAM